MLVIKLVILRDNVKSQLKGHAKSVCYEEEKYCQLELKPASSVDISSKLFVNLVYFFIVRLTYWNGKFINSWIVSISLCILLDEWKLRNIETHKWIRMLWQYMLSVDAAVSVSAL